MNEVVNFNGEEYIWYKTFPIHVGLIRGTKADEKGNISMEREGANLEALQVAQAVKNCGGIVIAQVEYLAKAGSLHAKSIQVPGVLVDYIVVSKNPQEWHMQSEGIYYQPAFSGDIVLPLGALPKLPFDERLFILRRAAMELTEKSVVNLGIGIPDRLANGAHEGVTISDAQPRLAAWAAFGWPISMSYNAEAFVCHPNMFDWYDGGGSIRHSSEWNRQHGNDNESSMADRSGVAASSILQPLQKVVYWHIHDRRPQSDCGGWEGQNPAGRQSSSLSTMLNR
jgi:propionate CoA-transferase